MNAVIDYKRKIYATRDLPTLPIIAQKILLLADDDGSGVDKLAKIIASDQALAVKVLSLANSAYYGHRAQISTVKQAIVVIGLDMLKQVALSVLIVKAFDRGGQKKRSAFWQHSLLAAHAASLIAKRTGGLPDDVCFMAALLHDVGKLILVSNLPEEYDQVEALVANEGCSVQEAEFQILDTDHAEVGAWMAERWQLPAELIDAIRLHHAADDGTVPLSQIVVCVQTANAIAQTPDAIMTPDHLKDIAPELERRAKEIHQFLT